MIKAYFPILRFNLYAQGYILILVKNTAEWKKLEVSMSTNITLIKVIKVSA